MKALQLKRGKEKPIFRKHPWIFSGAFIKLDRSIDAGDWVEVLDSDDNFICVGHFTPGSIAVRVLSYEKLSDKEAFYFQKINAAFNYRQGLNLFDENTNIYRLVFGEGDALPGLIVDNYDGNLVIQCHSAGMQNDVHLIADALKKLPIGISTIYVKHEKEGEFLLGDTGMASALENGNQFLINWQSGQKTGFFIDQRENRKLLGEFSKDKNVLNVFSYTGGFSVYALKNGASKVVSVDLSTDAIEMANKNAELNGVSTNHEGYAVDAFEYLKNEAINYDVVVLDPPAFAKRRNAIHNAVQGYKRLNALAMKKMKKGSILFTFSCSQNISSQLFNDTVRAAAIEAKRDIRIIKQLVQPEDHPINIYHPEGEYLKGLVLYID